MKKSIINTLVTTALITRLGFATTNAMAGRSFAQEQLVKERQLTKQKLEKAKASQGAEQQTLLSEHMRMLHENMNVCCQMKPKAGMTETERDEWFKEHKKLWMT